MGRSAAALGSNGGAVYPPNLVSPDSNSIEPREASEAGVRRHVTVMFSDLCGSGHLTHRFDPEIVAEVLQQLKDAAARVVEQHGGVVNQVYGDGVLAVFGFPLSHEDDVRRAAEAALELHEVISSIPRGSLLDESFEVRLHSGIDSGLVIAGPGDSALGRYELVGDPLNTAAGLCASANAGEVIASASTILGALPFFRTQELTPIAIKGKPEPVRAYRILGRSDFASSYAARVSRRPTPFVGRRFELRRLDECLREARRGHLQKVRLVGDAGLGKTRTIEKFIQQRGTSDCCVLRGYCESYGRAAPLHPFSILLERYFQLPHGSSTDGSAERVDRELRNLGLQEDADILLHLLSLRPTSAAAEAANQDRPDTVRALVRLFLAIAAHQPVILFIDDWQWVDDASRQVVESTMRAAADAPMLLVTASRELDTADPTMGDVESLVLEPFNKDESTSAVDALLPDPLDLGVTAVIHRQSGGNPLFIEELCLSPTEWANPGTPDSEVRPVPPTLHGLIEARVERLPADQAEALRSAAVIGTVIPSWLFHEITGVDEADGVVRELEMNDLIHSRGGEGTLRFKHGITRDVIYDSVGLKARRALHLKIAAALENRASSSGPDEHYELLAYHYSAGRNAPQAAKYAELAGNKALAAMALDRARLQYEVAMRALDQLGQTPDVRRRWISVCRRWAKACAYSPSRADLETLRKAGDAARELDDLGALARIQYWLGWILYALGDQTESIHHLESALANARELGNESFVAQFLATLGQSQAAACHYPEAFASLDEAIEMKRDRLKQHDSASLVGTAYAMATKAFALGDLGHFKEANSLIQSSLESIKGIEDAIQGSIRALQAAILIWQGRWEDSIRVAGLARATAAQVNGAYVFGMSSAESAYSRYMLDQPTEALEALKRSSDWLISRGMCLYISLNHGWLADASARAGNAKLVRRHAQGALDRAKHNDCVGEGMAYRALARLAARGQDDLEPPEHYLNLALESGRARSSRREKVMTELRLGELRISIGQRAQGLELLHVAREELLQMEMSWHAAEAQRLIEQA